MKTRYIRKHLFGLLLLLFCGCEEPYLPEVIDSPNRFLVVSGFINTGNSPTVIRLSRTQNLADNSPPTVEANALVRIEEEPGAVVATLNEIQPGTYISTHNINFNTSRKYRLYIRSGGKEFASEYVPVKVSPPIDSLSWKLQDDGVQIYVNTQDPENNTRYYRWEFEDTWEYNAEYYSLIEYVGERIQERTVNDIFICWRGTRSTDIKIGSSIKLTQDVMREAPVHKLPTNSDKLRRKYSILVRQQALTREEFEYWDILKKNTENIGTLFDPLPAQLTGNVKSLNNPGEPVIGFVGASSVVEKRLFISRSELPVTWRKPVSDCQLDTIQAQYIKHFFEDGYNVPVSELISETGRFLGYLSSIRRCVDCTMFGTNVQPDFWE